METQLCVSVCLYVCALMVFNAQTNGFSRESLCRALVQAQADRWQDHSSS